MKPIIDYEDNNILCPVSDNMAIDSAGNIYMRMSKNRAMDVSTGKTHLISSWPNDKEEK